MRVADRRRRKRPGILVPVASMGDIAFLLIIFFILVGTPKEPAVRLDLPRAVDLQDLARPPHGVAIDEDGVIYVNADRVAGADDVEAYLAALLGDAETREERFVLFRCHRALPRGVFEPVIEAISEAGGILLLVGEEERVATPVANDR